MLAIRTILHPTDFSERSGYAFEAAFALARDYAARLVVLHAATPPQAGAAGSDNDYREALQTKLHWLQPSGSPVPIEPLLVEGVPAAAILETARQCTADVIVLGTHGKTDERRRPMGSVAEKVIAQAPCPVIVVREPFVPALVIEEKAANSAPVIAALDELVATCKDGENGYRAAAADVKTTELKALFDFFGKQRETFAAELLAEVHRLDTPAVRKGSGAALIHRGWMNLKAALKRRDASAVIDECARGECAAAKNYETVLKRPLPPPAKALVEQQYARVKEAYERINGLRVIGVLNDLAATCKDGEKGFLAARGFVDDAELKELFFTSAKQRARLAAELRSEVRSLGDAGDVGGTFSAGLHREWMGLKAAAKRGGTQNVIAECLRGEQAALKTYAAAQERPLPPEIRAFVAKQSAEIKESRDRLAALQSSPVNA
jgi:uncharacterized protein (TIGR02284 family)